MIVRRAEARDIPRIVELGRRWLLEGPYRALIADNGDQVAQLTDKLLSVSCAAVLVADAGDGRAVGLLAVLVTPHPFSGEAVADELIWYVEPEYRVGGVGLTLLREAEEAARMMGAKRMKLTAPSIDTAALYKRCGYDFIEAGFVRTL